MTPEPRKAEAKENATKEHFCTMLDGKATVDKTLYEFTEKDLDHLIEHTYTQTIQSVRERVEGMRQVEEIDDYDGGYNHALDNVLLELSKDLEAPVEGDGV